MAALPKRKINLTIDQGIFSLAKDVAEKRGRSLSSIVEEFLARLAEESNSADWLNDFHSRYLHASYVEPSDQQLEKLRQGLKQKHS